MTGKKALELFKKHRTYADAAKAAGMVRSTFQRLLNDNFTREEIQPGLVVKKNLSQFKKYYDRSTYVPKRVRATLRELGSGWVYELEFIKSAGVNRFDLNAVREMFADHIVKPCRSSGKRIWVGTKTMANKMRQML